RPPISAFVRPCSTNWWSTSRLAGHADLLAGSALSNSARRYEMTGPDSAAWIASMRRAYSCGSGSVMSRVVRPLLRSAAYAMVVLLSRPRPCSCGPPPIPRRLHSPALARHMYKLRRAHDPVDEALPAGQALQLLRPLVAGDDGGQE